ncbi:uncharacterized protein LOC141912006 [Tubulanus polymorphus]|uniref:uncharacterized protein LOC141912006 n=1 Tax=Tubulanus polymorphus TaxID=672921 RepID=UPI003DA59E78
MGWFDAWREGAWNTWYPSVRVPAVVDVNTVIVGYITFVIGVACLVVAFGSRGEDRCKLCFKLVATILIESLLILCLISKQWRTSSGFVVLVRHNITCLMTMNLGLDGFNITMKVYRGCYRDCNTRDFTFTTGRQTPQHPDFCRKSCGQKGYYYAAVQNMMNVIAEISTATKVARPIPNVTKVASVTVT